jgi:D-3-phosphoglycerate dehydrogenase
MKKVLIPTKLSPVARELLEAHGVYEVVQNESDPLDQLASNHSDAYALIVRSEKVTPEIIDAMPGLKVIIRAGAGFNTIDTRYARKKGIDVMNTPGANANAVAEEVVAMMLADARHIVAADPSVRSGKWEKKNFMGREIAGKTVGIVGLGFIGKLVARRLSGFDVSLIGYDPMTSPERAREAGVELVEMEELFQRSDYISLHMPENDATRGIVNKSLLGVMKDGATLINCARAGIINNDDLAEVKASRAIRFLNDVYPKDEAGEKPIAEVSDLMLPHLGASTVEANANAASRAAQQLIEFDEKGITSYIVNRDIPAGLDETYADLAYTLAKLCRQTVGPASKLKVIETSFYGNLKDYAEWLLVPVICGLSEDFDRSMDHQAAHGWLKEHGIDYEDRETDEHKGFENSITIDMTAGKGDGIFQNASIRGTVAEGTLMISRINDFEKLYFEPRGHIVFFIYNDRPGVLGQIAASLASESVNIDDVRNPHNLKGTKSIAILQVNQKVSDEVVSRIQAEIDADVGCYVGL